MGASAWKYIIEYEPSIEDAFSKARWEIFKGGNYYKRPSIAVPSYNIWVQSFPPDMVDDIGEDGIKEMYEEEKSRNQSEPKTPDEAVRFAQEDGTHSLIDFMNMKFGNVFDEEQNQSTFGTTTPTLQQINEAGLEEYLERHSFCVVVAYEGEEKRKYVFCGVSGD